MTPAEQAGRAGGFAIPPMYDEARHPSNEMDTVLYVLTFLREAMAGQKHDELPLSEEAMFGFCLVLDGCMGLIRQAEAKV